MYRRNFLRKTAIASTLGATALAGCTGASSSDAPPRQSEVFDKINVKPDGTVEVALESLPTVQSRADFSANTGDNTDSSSNQNALDDVADDLNPVGVASAAKGRAGRGRAGGARSARKAGVTGRNGRAKLYGGTGNTYVFWWHDHKDEVKDHNARVKHVGIKRIADADAQEEDLPGPGVPEEGWDKKVGNPKATVSFKPKKPGWYRIGGHLVSKRGNHDFGWEAVDLLMKKNSKGQLEVTQSWKVSPRL